MPFQERESNASHSRLFIHAKEKTPDTFSAYDSLRCQDYEALYMKLSTLQLAKTLNISFEPSKLAKLDHHKLAQVCSHLLTRDEFKTYSREKWNDPLYWNIDDSAKNRSQYFAIGNAINFRYWDIKEGKVVPSTGIKREREFRGALYMWRCLRLCLEENKLPLLEASFLENITENEFDSIFGSDTGGNPLEVGKQDRVLNLRDLGVKLREKWDGYFFNLVQSCSGSLSTFADSSKRLRAYDDPYYKLTMVNAILHSGSGLVEFDSDPLPGIDYQLLKQLLRTGILVPTTSLSEKICNQRLLTAEEASELRRLALQAFAIMSEETGISGEILDNKWWWNRLKCLDLNPVCLDAATAIQCPFYGPCGQLTDYSFPLEITRYY